LGKPLKSYCSRSIAAGLQPAGQQFLARSQQREKGKHQRRKTLIPRLDGRPPFLVCALFPCRSFVLSSPAGLSSRSASPLSLSNHCNLFSPGRRSDGVMVRNCCRGSFLPPLCLDCISCPRACFLVRLRPSLYTFPILL
jgi:hypothetical protein